MPTYEGEAGRIIGFLWGVLWVTSGGSLGIWILDAIGALPPVVSTVVPELLLWSDDSAPYDGTVLPLVMFLCATLFLIYGGRELGGALFTSDYSITLTGKGP